MDSLKIGTGDRNRGPSRRARKPLQELLFPKNHQNQLSLKSRDNSAVSKKRTLYDEQHDADDGGVKGFRQNENENLPPTFNDAKDSPYKLRDASFFQSPLVVGGHILRPPGKITNIYRHRRSPSPESGEEEDHSKRGDKDIENIGGKRQKVSLKIPPDNSEVTKTSPRRRRSKEVMKTLTPPGSTVALEQRREKKRAKSPPDHPIRQVDPDSIQEAVDHWKERALNAEAHLKTLASPPRSKRRDSPSKDEIYWNQKYEELLQEKKNLEARLERAIKKIENMKTKKRASNKKCVEMAMEREEEWMQRYAQLVNTKNTLAEIVKEMQGVWELRYVAIREELRHLKLQRKEDTKENK